MFLDPASQVFSHCILPSFMRCLKAKISPRNFYANLFCLKSSEHSNNRHSENSTTTPHNPIHYLKPVHFKTVFIPECQLEPCCSLRLLMVVTFWGKAFSCRNVYILADSKQDFFLTPPRFTILVWCVSFKISTHMHPQQTHNSSSLGAGS